MRITERKLREIIREALDGALEEDDLDEADFDKDRMKCDAPRYLRKGEKGYGDKQKVVKACDKGKEKIIKFGDGKMRNRSSNPDAKRNFRARHNCDKKKDPMTAGYWSCKDW